MSCFCFSSRTRRNPPILLSSDSATALSEVRVVAWINMAYKNFSIKLLPRGRGHAQF